MQYGSLVEILSTNDKFKQYASKLHNWEKTVGCSIMAICFVKKVESVDNRVLYHTQDAEAIADPNYEPNIYVALRFKGERDNKGILITDKIVYYCKQVSSSWHGNVWSQLHLKDMEDIECLTTTELLKLKDIMLELVIGQLIMRGGFSLLKASPF